MTAFRRSNFWIADAIQFTCSAVATIGIKKFTYGNVSHEIQVCDSSLRPKYTNTHSFLLCPTESLSLSIPSLSPRTPSPLMINLSLSYFTGLCIFSASFFYYESYIMEGDENGQSTLSEEESQSNLKTIVHLI